MKSSVKATAYFALDSYSGVISKTTEPPLDYEVNPKVRININLNIKRIDIFKCSVVKIILNIFNNNF